MIEECRCTEGKGKIKQCQQRLIACIEMSAQTISKRTHGKKQLIQKAGFWWERGLRSPLTINELTKNMCKGESVRKKMAVNGERHTSLDLYCYSIRVLLFGDFIHTLNFRKLTSVHLALKYQTKFAPLAVQITSQICFCFPKGRNLNSTDRWRRPAWLRTAPAPS